MYQLFIKLAKEIPEDMLFEDLENALKEYKLQKTDKTKEALNLIILLASQKYISKDKNVAESIKDADQILAIHNSFKNQKQ